MPIKAFMTKMPNAKMASPANARNTFFFIDSLNERIRCECKAKLTLKDRRVWSPQALLSSLKKLFWTPSARGHPRAFHANTQHRQGPLVGSGKAFFDTRPIFEAQTNLAKFMSKLPGIRFETSPFPIRQGLLFLGSLSFVLILFSGCSVQKRTTQRGWHVESAVWRAPRGPQTELVRNKKAKLDFQRTVPAPTKGPRIFAEKTLLNGSKPIPAPSLRGTSPTELVQSTYDVDTLEQRVNETPNLPQTDNTHPVAAQQTGDTPAGEDSSSWIFAGAMSLVAGLGMLPSPIGALLIALGPILLLVGRLVKLSRDQKAKNRAGRAAGNTLLILVLGFFGGVAAFLLALSAAMSGWSNPFEGMGWGAIGWW